MINRQIVRTVKKIWYQRTLIILFLFNGKIQRSFWYTVRNWLGEVVLLIFMALAWVCRDHQPTKQTIQPTVATLRIPHLEANCWSCRVYTVGSNDFYNLVLSALLLSQRYFCPCAAVVHVPLLSMGLLWFLLYCCCPCVTVVPVLLLSMCRC